MNKPVGSVLAFFALAGLVAVAEATTVAATAVDLQSVCQAGPMQQMAAALKSTRVSVQAVENGPFKSATSFVAAARELPAYCQVTGSFVTNPKTGKTANFLATLPANWNGKYLQLGCSGHCGQFFVSDAARASITVTNQGSPGQIISKGYASFATDEGHTGNGRAEWADKGPGQVDRDALDDFYYRADQTLAKVGKEFTTAFYRQVTGAARRISRSYFSGCSGGGRDAFVTAAYFPEEFDGIIGGSAYNLMGTTLYRVGLEQAAARSEAAQVPAPLLALIDPIVKAKCDRVDGVEDGIIQNPAACDFRPDRDLPRCANNQPGDQCFTQAQIETLSVVLSAVTDEQGKVIQPAHSVSELQPGLPRPQPAAQGNASGPGPVSQDSVLKVFAYGNDPAYSAPSLYTFKSGGPGRIDGFHAVVPRAEADRIIGAASAGIGHFPEKADQLIKLDRKFLIWHNFSDEALTPYMSINYYKQLARRHGGYAKLQQNVRLFMLPGTAHCSITGVGPNSFDALTAIEDWVEKGNAPDALRASVADHQFSPGLPKAAALKYPNWTATLCKFPEMARYGGSGDMKDAGNWSCPADDTRLLQVGESGRQAGLIE